MAFLGTSGLLRVIVKGVDFENAYDPASYTTMLIVLGIAAVLARWLTVTVAKSEVSIVQFEDLAPPVILGLGLHGDGSFN